MMKVISSGDMLRSVGGAVGVVAVVDGVAACAAGSFCFFEGVSVGGAGDACAFVALIALGGFDAVDSHLKGCSTFGTGCLHVVSPFVCFGSPASVHGLAPMHL